MIPKIIHYCWFGRGEKPELAKSVSPAGASSARILRSASGTRTTLISIAARMLKKLMQARNTRLLQIT